MIVTPYVSTAEFTAHPTYLDVDDLRVGDPSQGDQTAELNNVLLMASGMADRYCEQPLAAHVVVQNTRARADRYGNLKIHPDNTPVLSFTSVAYGSTPTALTTLAGSSGVWIEDGRNIVVPLSAGGLGPWSGALQFGSPSAGCELYVQLVYIAGHPATELAVDAVQGATSLTVLDPTGILPGSTYRIWEPGSEEYVTVSTTYIPAVVTIPPTPTAIPLAAPTMKDHTAGMGFSGLPPEAHTAVINFGVAQLLRPDTAKEDSYPDTRYSSGTRQDDPRQDGSGLVAEAQRLLAELRRIR